jgi:hypothetical protein
LQNIEEGSPKRICLLVGVAQALLLNHFCTVCVRATTRLTETAVGAIGFVPRLRVSGRECCGSSG